MAECQTSNEISKKEICRLCLGINLELFNIFQEDTKVYTKIQLCCALKVDENDGLPDKICSACTETLDYTFNFRAQCQENDKILRSMSAVSYTTTVKIENLYQGSDEDLDVNDVLTIEHSKLPKIKATKKTKKSIIKVKLPTKAKHKQHKSNLCTICGTEYAKRSSYYTHMRMHKEKMFICNECTKTFRSKAHLQSHMLTHFGVKNIPCEECGKCFASKEYVLRHVDQVHRGAKRVECTVCHKSLFNSKSLKCHMKIHTGEMDYVCEICSRRFTDKSSLRYHIRMHLGEKPYGCQYCDKRFSISKSRKDHERLHTGETPYSCPVCSKGFAQLSNMKSHFRYNHKHLNIKDFSYLKKQTDNTGDDQKVDLNILENMSRENDNLLELQRSEPFNPFKTTI